MSVIVLIIGVSIHVNILLIIFLIIFRVKDLPKCKQYCDLQCKLYNGGLSDPTKIEQIYSVAVSVRQST
jgi:hypothetical protein